MMKAIMFACIVLFAGIVQGCHTGNGQMTHDQLEGMAHSLNRLRSQVATGQREIHFAGDSSNANSASNMNVLHWDSGLARAAESCSSSCPMASNACVNLLQDNNQHGFVKYTRIVSSTGDQFNAQQSIDQWFSDQTAAKQILFARESTFGCSRSIDSDERREYLVCVFNKRPGNGNVFERGSPASTCGDGNSPSSHYVGLCSTPFNLLQQQHKVLHAHKKHNKKTEHHKKVKPEWKKDQAKKFEDANQWIQEHDAQTVISMTAIEFM